MPGARAGEVERGGRWGTVGPVRYGGSDRRRGANNETLSLTRGACNSILKAHRVNTATTTAVVVAAAAAATATVAAMGNGWIGKGLRGREAVAFN